MTNRKWLLGLFSIFFITTIFAERNRVLWDFGVIIKTSAQQKTSKKYIKSFSNSEIGTSSQVMALIADPFIPPTLTYLDKKVYVPPIFLDSLAEISLKNLHKIKLIAGRLTMQINYQPIINMMSKIDCSKLDEKDCIDLNYWLANAFLQTGKYLDAEDIILTNMELAMDDRFHFLLAMTYEAKGKKGEAHKKYIEFIKQFPKSDYKVTALIKARMLAQR